MSTSPPFFRFESKSEFPGKKLRKFVHANIFTIVIQISRGYVSLWLLFLHLSITFNYLWNFFRLLTVGSALDLWFRMYDQYQTHDASMGRLYIYLREWLIFMVCFHVGKLYRSFFGCYGKSRKPLDIWIHWQKSEIPFWQFLGRLLLRNHSENKGKNHSVQLTFLEWIL